MNDLQVEYFLAVAENLSFTKTASEKYVSQPAISKQIAAMEEELGVVLFERQHKAVVLTEAGKIFADFYKKQKQDLDLITKQAKETHKKKKILLKVGCGSNWMMTDFMPGIIKTLAAEHPEIKISLESYSFHKLASTLAEDEADIVIALSTSLYASPALEIHTLAHIPRVIVYSESHPIRGVTKEKALTPYDFKNETFFVPEPNEAVRIAELVRSFCEPYGFVPKIQGVKSTESLILNVMNGLGVAITDSWTVQAAREGLLNVPLDSEHIVQVGWRKNNENPAIPVFLKELESIFYPKGDFSFIMKPS